jgi:putative membrane protein insertion efficiency factor
VTADPRAPRDGRGPLARALLAVVGFYQRAISPAFPPRCRFQPTCSAYAAEAIAVHGAGRGSWLALRRLLKCAPWHPGGLDLVPPVRTTPPASARPVPSAPRRAPQEESPLA